MTQHFMEVQVDDKNAMISLVYQDWQEAGSSFQHLEFFQALIELIKTDRITAFYDDTDGCVKYEAIQ